MPVRSKVRGTRADHFTTTEVDSPGATGRGRGTTITVRSSAFPSSGAMKRRDGVRSPDAIVGPGVREPDRVDRECQKSPGRLWSGPERALSRIRVDLVSTHAFQYRWNCSSLVDTCVMLRQVMTSDAVIVRVRRLEMGDDLVARVARGEWRCILRERGRRRRCRQHRTGDESAAKHHGSMLALDGQRRV